MTDCPAITFGHRLLSVLLDRVRLNNSIIQCNRCIQRTDARKCQAENTPPSSLHSDLSQCTEMGHWPKKKHSSIPKLQYHWYENLGEAALPCSPRPLPCKVHASAKQVCALDEFQVRHLLHASAASAFAWTHPYDPMHTGLARPPPFPTTQPHSAHTTFCPLSMGQPPMPCTSALCKRTMRTNARLAQAAQAAPIPCAEQRSLRKSG